MVQHPPACEPPYEFPLHLSREEMQQPIMVILDYYGESTLEETRAALKEWLDDSLHNPSVNAKDRVFLYDNMIKLVEAGWLLSRDITT